MPTSGDLKPPGVDVAWAKSWPMQPGLQTHWLPLWQHLDDSLGVAGWLWDTWVTLATRRLIGDAFPGGEDDGRTALMWLAGMHDVGKASPPFAHQVPCLANRMVRAGLPGRPTVKPSELRHEVVSAWALRDWLNARGWSRRQSAQFCCLLAAHHGYFLQESARPGLKAGNAGWAEVRNYLLDRAAHASGALERLPDWQAVTLPQAVQMQLSALVVMADWMASSDHFPLLPLEQLSPCPPAVGDAGRMRRGTDGIDLGGIWHPRPAAPDPVEAFKLRFPEISTPRPLQSKAAEAAALMDAPGLMIIEGPMGVGKTEAALIAAETMAARSGCRGVFVALPTQATTDAMFSRVHQWLDRVAEDQSGGALSLSLVHGKAALNSEFQTLRWRSHSPVYEDASSGVGVAEWMQGRKRAALSSFVVGTIDQVLFAALNAKHVMLRQLSLHGKVVILDEVHAADSYMLVFLSRALEWMGAGGVPVILMSATLPSERRRSLYEAYESGRCRRSPDSIPEQSEGLVGDVGYPVITVTAPDGPQVLEVEPSRDATSVTFLKTDDSPDRIAALLEDLLQDGGCAVVIRNTVTRVQEMARVLIDRFESSEITVAHARFLAADRVRIDSELLRKFGPPDATQDRPRRHIVVASQVVEQSLDVDFDLMISDVAPIDLLMQRVGRLHRHQRGKGQSERPSRLRSATCYIAGVDWSESPPKLGPSKVIYGAYPLWATLAVLDDHLLGQPVQFPQDIATLVQAGYADHLQPPENWPIDWESARIHETVRQQELAQRAKPFCLTAVQKDGHSLFGLSRAALSADEDARGQAAVRDNAEDSVEVVVVQSIEGAFFLPMWVTCDDHQLPVPDEPLDWRQAAVLASCTVRLPYNLCNPGNVDAVIAELEGRCFPGWQRTPLLAGQLPLILDQDGHGKLLGFDLFYDQQLGLIAERGIG